MGEMSKEQSRQEDLGEQLRRAVTKAGLNRFAISQRTGLSYSVVHGFLGGERDIMLGTASKLAAVLGLELRPARRPRKGR